MPIPTRLARLAALALAAPLLATAPLPSKSSTGTLHGHARHRRHVAHRASPVPDAPAATPVASNVSPAPVPNESVSPPDAPAPQANVAPSVFQLHYPPVGEGYVTGSSSQAMDDREAAKATGVQMTVPLQ